MTDGFFVVWCRDTGYTNFIHSNKESAEKEAERLATLHKGKNFVVLAAVSSICVEEVKRQTFIYGDDIPF